MRITTNRRVQVRQREVVSVSRIIWGLIAHVVLLRHDVLARLDIAPINGFWGIRVVPILRAVLGIARLSSGAEALLHDLPRLGSVPTLRRGVTAGVSAYKASPCAEGATSRREETGIEVGTFWRTR